MWISLFKLHVSEWKIPSAQLSRPCAAAKRQSGSGSCTTAFAQWRRSLLPAKLGRPRSSDAMHPNGSGRSQCRPMQAYPLRLSSILKLWGFALKRYPQEHRASSGSGMCQNRFVLSEVGVGPHSPARCAVQICKVSASVPHCPGYPILFRFFHRSLLVQKTEGLVTCTLIQAKNCGLNSNQKWE